MGFLPTTKWGDCCQCSATNCAVIKVGKYTYCIKCHKANKNQEQISKSKEKNKIRGLSIAVDGKSTYRKPEDNKFVNNEAVKRLNRLNIFFSECAVEISKNPFCLNCGEPISFPLSDTSNEVLVKAQLRDYRNATAHILPKNIFHSVETHPLIWLPLGAKCGCHHDTHRLDKFSKMRVFPEAVRRFRIFQPLITEKHKLLDEFIRYADQILL